MNILMPQLGETVAEGKITKWFKVAGDAVKPGDNLFEIETDKVSMEVPATEAGVLSEIRVPEGEVAPVGAIVGVIGDGTGGVVSAPAKPAAAVAATPKTQTAASPAAPERTPPAKAPQQPIKLDPFFEVRTPERNFGPARLSGGIFVTPLARRLASEAGIDLSRLRGSGPHGRIVARDVETAPRPTAAPGLAALAEGPSADQVKALFDPAGYEEVPLDAMRKTIAARLTQAKQTIPHFYLTADITIDRLIAVREEANAAAAKDRDGNPAFKLSLNDFVIRALALALQRVPAANAAWAGDRILRSQAFRHRRRRGAGRRPDRADRPQCRDEIAQRHLGRDEGTGGADTREEAEADRLPGRLIGDFQSRHVRRARVLGHHQPAASYDPGGRRRTPPSGREGRRRRRLRQHAHGDVVLRPSRGRRRTRRRTTRRD